MKSKRITSWVSAAVLSLGLSAATLGLSTDARADDLRVGMVNAKNVVERTVTIDDVVYRVTSSTRILGPDGSPVRLSDVVTEADMGNRVVLERVTWAYDAAGGTVALMRKVDAPR